MVGFQVTAQHCSSVVSIFMQESKRSVRDLCGRTDGNVKVVFPKEDVAVQPAESNTAQVNAGDYVLVKVGFVSSIHPSWLIINQPLHDMFNPIKKHCRCYIVFPPESTFTTVNCPNYLKNTLFSQSSYKIYVLGSYMDTLLSAKGGTVFIFSQDILF